MNARVKDFFDFFLERFKGVRVGKDDLFDFVHKAQKTHFMRLTAFTVEVFANEGLIIAMLTETYEDGLIAFGTFRKVNRVIGLVLRHKDMEV